MFLPFRLLALELKQTGCWKEYLHYEKYLGKSEKNSLRIKFLENCKRADLIPKFLKFRIPNNGSFDEKSVHEFQQKLLNKEILKAKNDFKTTEESQNEKRKQLKAISPSKCLPSIILHTRIRRCKLRREHQKTHNKKLTNLSEEQERPLFSVPNTVVLYNLENPPPLYIIRDTVRKTRTTHPTGTKEIYF